MSWNGSDHVGAELSSHPKDGGISHSSTSRFNNKALFVGFVVVVVVGLSCWLIRGRSRSNSAPPRQDPSPSTRIKAVTPTGAPEKEKTFHNYADRQIAALIAHRPGDKIIGNPRCENGFKEQFFKSLYKGD